MYQIVSYSFNRILKQNLRLLFLLLLEYKNTKITSTQQSKIHNARHSSKDYQEYQAVEKYYLKLGERLNQPIDTEMTHISISR